MRRTTADDRMGEAYSPLGVAGGGGGGFLGIGDALGGALGGAVEAALDNPIMEAVADAAQFVVAPIATAAVAPVKAVTHVLAQTGIDAFEDINSALTDVYQPLAHDAVEQWKIGAQVGAAIAGGATLPELLGVGLTAAAEAGGGAAPELPAMQDPTATVAVSGAPPPQWMPLALGAGAVVLLLSLLRR